jgi:serine protease Do
LPVSHGLLVASVQPGSAAAKAGLRAAKQSATLAGETYPLGGDLIASADGAPLYTIDQLRDTIAGKRPGDRLKLHVYRGSDARSVTVQLGREPTAG